MQQIITPWALFACDQYEPYGGSDDIVGRFATRKDALIAANSQPLSNYDRVWIERLDVHPLYANLGDCIPLLGQRHIHQHLIDQTSAQDILPPIYPINYIANRDLITYTYVHALPTACKIHLTYDASYARSREPNSLPNTMYRTGNINARIIQRHTSAIPSRNIQLPDGDLSVIRDALRTALQSHHDLSPEQRALYAESVDTLICDDISERLETSFILD